MTKQQKLLKEKLTENANLNMTFNPLIKKL